MVGWRAGIRARRLSRWRWSSGERVARVASVLIVILAAFTLLPVASAQTATSPASKSEAPLYRASHALVIGNDAYRSDNWPRLSNGVRDAFEVARALEAQGFAVSLKTDLTRAALVDALEAFVYGPGSDPNARLVIWFAGHGHTIDGEGYLVPIDAAGPSDGVAFRRSSLSMRRFGEYMREAKANHALAIFDSCFAGTVFDTARAAVPPAITRATALPVRQFITSGEAEQEVSDDGTFRKLFISALDGSEPRADSNGDGYVTGSELGLFVEQRVTNLTDNRQTPRSGKLKALGLDRGDIVFKVGMASQAAPRSPRSGAAATEAPSQAAPRPDPCAGANPPLSCLWRKR